MIHFDDFLISVLVIITVFIGLFFIFYHLARWYVSWELSNEKKQRRSTNERHWKSKGLNKFIFETENGSVEIYALNHRNAVRKFINAGFTEKMPENVK